MPTYIKKITSIIVIMAFLAAPEWSVFASDASGSRSSAQKVRYIRDQAGLCPEPAYALRKIQTQEGKKGTAKALGGDLGQGGRPAENPFKSVDTNITPLYPSDNLTGPILNPPSDQSKGAVPDPTIKGQVLYISPDRLVLRQLPREGMTVPEIHIGYRDFETGRFIRFKDAIEGNSCVAVTIEDMGIRLDAIGCDRLEGALRTTWGSIRNFLGLEAPLHPVTPAAWTIKIQSFIIDCLIFYELKKDGVVIEHKRRISKDFRIAAVFFMLTGVLWSSMEPSSIAEKASIAIVAGAGCAFVLRALIRGLPILIRASRAKRNIKPYLKISELLFRLATTKAEFTDDKADAEGRALGAPTVASADGEDEQIDQKPKNTSSTGLRKKIKGWHIVLSWLVSLGWIFLEARHLRQLGLPTNIGSGPLLFLAVTGILTWYYFGGFRMPDGGKSVGAAGKASSGQSVEPVGEQDEPHDASAAGDTSGSTARADGAELSPQQLLEQEIQGRVKERKNKTVSGDEAVAEAEWLLERLIYHSDCTDELFRSNMPAHMRELPDIVRELTGQPSAALLIASMLHDADRFFEGNYIRVEDAPPHDSPAYLEYKVIQHPNMSADFIVGLLRMLGVDEALVLSVDLFIRNHETGIIEERKAALGPFVPEQHEYLVEQARILCDADAISMFTPVLFRNAYIQLGSELGDAGRKRFFEGCLVKYGRVNAKSRQVIDKILESRRDEYIADESGRIAYEGFMRRKSEVAPAAGQAPGERSEVPSLPRDSTASAGGAYIEVPPGPPGEGIESNWIKGVVPYDTDNGEIWAKKTASQFIKLFRQNRERWDRLKSKAVRSIFKAREVPAEFNPDDFVDSVNEGIRELVYYVNRLEFACTTSSCAHVPYINIAFYKKYKNKPFLRAFLEGVFAVSHRHKETVNVIFEDWIGTGIYHKDRGTDRFTICTSGQYYKNKPESARIAFLRDLTDYVKGFVLQAVAAPEAHSTNPPASAAGDAPAGTASAGGAAQEPMFDGDVQVPRRGRDPNAHKDYYKILGISTDATSSDIRDAYKNQVRSLGPQVNSGDRQANDSLADVNEAYEILSDPERRTLYERMHKDPHHYNPSASVVMPDGTVMRVLIIDDERKPWDEVTEEEMDSSEFKEAVRKETERIRIENKRYITTGLIISPVILMSMVGLFLIWNGPATLPTKIFLSIIPGIVFVGYSFAAKCLLWDGIVSLRNAEWIARQKIRDRMNTWHSMRWFLNFIYGDKEGVKEEGESTEGRSRPLQLPAYVPNADSNMGLEHGSSADAKDAPPTTASAGGAGLQNAMPQPAAAEGVASVVHVPGAGRASAGGAEKQDSSLVEEAARRGVIVGAQVFAGTLGVGDIVEVKEGEYRGNPEVRIIVKYRLAGAQKTYDGVDDLLSFATIISGDEARRLNWMKIRQVMKRRFSDLPDSMLIETILRDPYHAAEADFELNARIIEACPDGDRDRVLMHRMVVDLVRGVSIPYDDVARLLEQGSNIGVVVQLPMPLEEFMEMIRVYGEKDFVVFNDRRTRYLMVVPGLMSELVKRDPIIREAGHTSFYMTGCAEMVGRSHLGGIHELSADDRDLAAAHREKNVFTVSLAGNTIEFSRRRAGTEHWLRCQGDRAVDTLRELGIVVSKKAPNSFLDDASAAGNATAGAGGEKTENILSQPIAEQAVKPTVPGTEFSVSAAGERSNVSAKAVSRARTASASGEKIHAINLMEVNERVELKPGEFAYLSLTDIAISLGIDINQEDGVVVGPNTIFFARGGLIFSSSMAIICNYLVLHDRRNDIRAFGHMDFLKYGATSEALLPIIKTMRAKLEVTLGINPQDIAAEIYEPYSVSNLNYYGEAVINTSLLIDSLIAAGVSSGDIQKHADAEYFVLSVYFDTDTGDLLSCSEGQQFMDRLGLTEADLYSGSDLTEVAKKPAASAAGEDAQGTAPQPVAAQGVASTVDAPKASAAARGANVRPISTMVISTGETVELAEVMIGENGSRDSEIVKQILDFSIENFPGDGIEEFRKVNQHFIETSDALKIFIGTINGEIIATAMYMPIPDGFYRRLSIAGKMHRKEEIAFGHNLAVKKAYWRNLIGTKLYEIAQEAARIQGFTHWVDKVAVRYGRRRIKEDKDRGIKWMQVSENEPATNMAFYMRALTINGPLSDVVARGGEAPPAAARAGGADGKKMAAEKSTLQIVREHFGDKDILKLFDIGAFYGDFQDMFRALLSSEYQVQDQGIDIDLSFALEAQKRGRNVAECPAAHAPERFGSHSWDIVTVMDPDLETIPHFVDIAKQLVSQKGIIIARFSLERLRKRLIERYGDDEADKKMAGILHPEGYKVEVLDYVPHDLPMAEYDKGEVILITPAVPGREMRGDVVSDVEGLEPIDWEGGISYGAGQLRKEIKFKTESGNFMEGLTEFLKERGIKDGIILMTEKGTFTGPVLGFFMTHQEPRPDFDQTVYKEEVQIVTLMGTIVNGIPHVHVLLSFIREDRRLVGGHLIKTEDSDIEVKVIPITGLDGKRAIDPDTGVGHFRTGQSRDASFDIGNEILFTVAPAEEFPKKLLEVLKENGARKVQLRTAIGTFKSVEIQEKENEKPTLVSSEDGLELLWSAGEITVGDEPSWEITVGLMDHNGNYYSGKFVKGMVKDLVEGNVTVAASAAGAAAAAQAGGGVEAPERQVPLQAPDRFPNDSVDVSGKVAGETVLVVTDTGVDAELAAMLKEQGTEQVITKVVSAAAGNVLGQITEISRTIELVKPDSVIIDIRNDSIGLAAGIASLPGVKAVILPEDKELWREALTDV